ncbi:hypothetical protein ZIOFF_059116 [Zingiber officinale]|uniref:Uncharacterized protein n=1 Tax=Zingiber officinale TaxID=94328 RepID=A0A8J5F902_ZINOF|nr:hypothetical protein ZIOFF_059116 [Zingiber officinale]
MSLHIERPTCRSRTIRSRAAPLTADVASLAGKSSSFGIVQTAASPCSLSQFLVPVSSVTSPAIAPCPLPLHPFYGSSRVPPSSCHCVPCSWLRLALALAIPSRIDHGSDPFWTWELGFSILSLSPLPAARCDGGVRYRYDWRPDPVNWRHSLAVIPG